MSGTNSDWAILKSQAERIFADPIFFFVKHPQISRFKTESQANKKVIEVYFFFVCVPYFLNTLESFT